MLACLTLLFLGVGLGHLFHLYTEKNRDPEKCTVPVIVFYNNTQANLTLDFMYSLKKRTGVVSISGTYYVDNKMSGVIRRNVSYVWSENKDSTHFISTDINKVTRDETLSDAVIETVLPDFYVYPGKSISYTILTQGHRGFMFTIGKRPIFFCTH
ncbi:hypothetical protein O6448_17160 [Salmonella enterica subsp. enterica]|uniref:Inner membrane protein n=3 Tax=Salmonella enterica TaxID=28901 RepID=A0A764NQB5_SALER|nr:hypothetical protein [Salmonella enterica]AET56045.1 hypothetical protein SPUL_3805 [Salmonella enterica subsp. enterica serovar Gallinarum/Pullorum str. RKS5078]EIE5306612.1 hypothetical protein [Salmonella enterica subsp. enterica serovar Enteritidis]MCP1351641.1 hypothetical protein [Salmonella sp. S87]QUZ43522.1 hypothetical protein JYN58_00385 [Salmonella enterica subsp. enterica serovar Pullorum str. CFSAN000606]WGZ41985.1 hypothetical protein PWA52_00385 [Salmonella sp. CVCC 1806]